MQFINSLNHYRAIAIILIVATHCFSISEIEFNSTFSNVYRNLVAGSTINFVFISGFLFHSIFYKKYSFKTFIQGKFSKIILPYLLLSIIPITISLILKPNYWEHTFWFCGSNISELGCHLISALKYLLTGSHLVSYWYIPFVTLLFLMSPLHKRFIDLSTNTQLTIIVLLAGIALFLHRPYDNSSVFKASHSLVYFTPLYLFGIICSKHKTKIYKWFKNKELFLLFSVFGLAYYQSEIGQSGLYLNQFFEFGSVPDLLFIQKVFMCLFFMVWLHRFEDFKSSKIDLVAKLSFPIYFLHGYVLRALTVLKAKLEISVEYHWVTYFIILAFLILLSMLIAILIAKIIPSYSRYVIGFGKKLKVDYTLTHNQILQKPNYKVDKIQ